MLEVDGMNGFATIIPTVKACPGKHGHACCQHARLSKAPGHVSDCISTLEDASDEA